MGFEELKMKLGDWELRVENGIGGVEDETWEWEEIKREEYVANASQNLRLEQDIELQQRGFDSRTSYGLDKGSKA